MDYVTGDPAVRLRVAVPYVGKPPSINEISGKHWSAAKKHRDPWHQAAAKALAGYDGPRPLGPSLIRITFPVATRARRDPANYTGTLGKWLVDALVRDGLFVDDTPDHIVVVDPRIVHRSWLKDPDMRARALVLVDIVPLSALNKALAGAPEEVVDLFRPALPE